jgi:hypothetical protein
MSKGNDEKSQLPNRQAEAAEPRSELIPPALESVLRNIGVDPKTPDFSRALEITLTMMYGGASQLPPPAVLKEYGKIRSELIDKLVTLTERQSDHRREMERH